MDLWLLHQWSQRRAISKTRWGPRTWTFAAGLLASLPLSSASAKSSFDLALARLRGERLGLFEPRSSPQRSFEPRLSRLRRATLRSGSGHPRLDRRSARRAKIGLDNYASYLEAVLGTNFDWLPVVRFFEPRRRNQEDKRTRYILIRWAVKSDPKLEQEGEPMLRSIFIFISPVLRHRSVTDKNLNQTRIKQVDEQRLKNESSYSMFLGKYSRYSLFFIP